jgi:hypothetical protein
MGATAAETRQRGEALAITKGADAEVSVAGAGTCAADAGAYMNVRETELVGWPLVSRL